MIKQVPCNRRHCWGCPAEGMRAGWERSLRSGRRGMISGREFGGSDTYATSQIIAAAIHTGAGREDIIFCGRQAIDGDTQVGPQIAEKLDIPQVTYAGKVEMDGKRVGHAQLMEDGYMRRWRRRLLPD